MSYSWEFFEKRLFLAVNFPLRESLYSGKLMARISGKKVIGFAQIFIKKRFSNSQECRLPKKYHKSETVPFSPQPELRSVPINTENEPETLLSVRHPVYSRSAWKALGVTNGCTCQAQDPQANVNGQNVHHVQHSMLSVYFLPNIFSLHFSLFFYTFSLQWNSLVCWVSAFSPVDRIFSFSLSRSLFPTV